MENYPLGMQAIVDHHCPNTHNIAKADLNG